MALYVYTARDREGLLQTGNVEAMDPDAALGVLQGRGLIVTSLASKETIPLHQLRQARLRRGLRLEDKVLFCRQLSTMIEAGIPLLRSLEVLSLQIESRPLYEATRALLRDIEAGFTFRDALAKHTHVFSTFWVNLVETGEASGHLAQSLNQLANYLESANQLQRKAVTALTYPAVLIGAAVVALGIFIIRVVPIFAGIFKNFNVPLPWLTQGVVAISLTVKEWFLVVVAAVVAGSYLLRRFLKTEQGGWMWDRMLLKIPVFQRLFHQLQLAQFSRGLATLLESGVPILFSLEIMERSATNRVYGRALGEVKEYVREGKPMAEPLEQSGLFPPMVVQMVQVGEEIGELAKMLNRVAKFYEDRVSVFVERLTILFEPIAIAVMAVVIGSLITSMFLPIFSLVGGIRG